MQLDFSYGPLTFMVHFKKEMLLFTLVEWNYELAALDHKPQESDLLLLIGTPKSYTCV